MELISALTYYIDLENWDINFINKIANIYDKITKSIIF